MMNTSDNDADADTDTDTDTDTDDCNMFGVGLSTVVSVVYEMVNAVNRAFIIKFSEDHNEQSKIARGFQQRSSVGFKCVAGCVDGLIIWTDMPTQSDCDLLKIGPRRFY